MFCVKQGTIVARVRTQAAIPPPGECRFLFAVVFHHGHSTKRSPNDSFWTLTLKAHVRTSRSSPSESGKGLYDGGITILV